MATVNGCNIPEDLLYDVDPEANAFTWAKDNGDGTYTVGLTSVAAAMAGRLVAYTPKKPGKVIERRKSIATIESGKWVGPVPTPLTGEIVEINEALKGNPALVNDDPYGAGWIAKIKPTNPEEVNNLLKGQAAVDALTKVINEKGIKCG
ncbi:MAG: glycine cleavage system protein H [Aquificota bacterium]|jgi:glycine cleavage system H protein|uniref:Glycine cleavage system H protein n=1 Tax=Hydrogenobacter sp. TaxID=2152829 RepID=A0A7C2ZES3_9AQUI|nr:glycine cleavage system protein H [Aquificaceae bacterium]MDM7267464.1 glycine cleavage system protein H [Aquificaceae bacterium]QWK13621.1 MAG: glycine cleavage system protein H [Aquificota bacterium]HAV40138.1 glycine cleavage system protein H [Aquificaceae bacterium]HCO39395.1 glycine cleavage system protein H [Aquificaceae bacterium]